MFARSSPRQRRHPGVGSVAAFALMTAATFAAGPDPQRGDSRPNIVFILADDLGSSDLGCYGSPFIATPNLDRMAAEGTRFTNAYSGSPVCAPARGVLMTGRHTGHARIRANSPRVGGQLEPFAGGREGGMRLSLEPSDFTVAELVRGAGYATGIAGKWGLGEAGSAGTPNRQGFDEWLGYLNQNHASYHYPEYLDHNEGRREIPENAGGRTVVYGDDLCADFGLEFVRRHAGRPFFLYLPFTLPHALMQVPDLGAYAARDWPADAKTYAAMVTRLDSYVGRLLAELDRLGLARNTIVFFASDNGPAKAARSDFLRSAGSLRGRKGSVYEGGIRVPLLVRWPGRVPAGRVSDTPWMFVDFIPTCATLAGLPVPAGIDGVDFLPHLTGREPAPAERPLYWEMPEDGVLWQAARLGRWKAVRPAAGRPVELYDLAADPAESSDVAATHPDVTARLRAFLDASHQPSPHWPNPAP